MLNNSPINPDNSRTKDVEVTGGLSNKVYAPSMAELGSAAQLLASKSFLGIQGVHVIDSHKPGPFVAVTCCTHGNEPSGLVPIWSEFKERTFSRALTAGKIAFILNNQVAALKSFQCTNEEDRRQCRFVDLNMNRMPEDALEGTSGGIYEINRLRELMPLYRDIEAALDIHSTSQDSPPMVLEIKNFRSSLMRGFGIPQLITNISEIQVGVPIGYFLGGLGGDASVIEIEAGQHFLSASYCKAMLCTESFLRSCGVISPSATSRSGAFDGTDSEVQPYLHEYKITNSILFPDESFLLEKVFSDFGVIQAGDVIARGEGGTMVAEHDGHTFFATPQRRPASIREEALFLSEPVRKTLL